MMYAQPIPHQKPSLQNTLLGIIAVVIFIGSYLFQFWASFGKKIVTPNLPDSTYQTAIQQNLEHKVASSAVNSTISLIEIAPFQWQEVCVFGGYSGTDIINKTLGVEWLHKTPTWIPIFGNQQYWVDENTSLLVFIDQNHQVITHAEVTSLPITISDKPCFEASEAQFTIRATTTDGTQKSLHPVVKLKRGELPVAAKPVIYLYPTTSQSVTVQLDFAGELTYTYPEYDPQLGGWQVIANPDGTLINPHTSQQYNYLFWEGNSSTQFHPKSGFVVSGSETRQFLETTLTQIGLNSRETNEFIVFWYPKLAANPYNFIYFATDEYTSQAKLTISPKPDSMLRVFMVTVPLQQPISVPEQLLTRFERRGFSVIEWGGLEQDTQSTNKVFLPQE